MSFATDNADAVKQTAQMGKLISDNGGGIGGFGKLMWDGISSGFDRDKHCVFAHTVGEFAFGIILGILTGGEALAQTAVGRAIKASVGVLDRLDVVSQVVSKTAGCVLKITYKAGKPVFNVLYNGVKVLPKFFTVPVSGRVYSFIIPLPQLNLKGGIEAFKEAIAKGEVKVERVLDKADNIITDEEGNILNKAISKDGEEVELLEKGLAGSALVNALSPNLKAIHDRLVNGGVGVFEQGDVLKYVTKNGNEFAKIENGVFSVTVEQGSIPLPEKYLDATYIVQHINKFNQEGGAFVIRKSDLSNPEYITLAPRKFMGLKSEMDAVMKKYKDAGNNPQVLIDELDLGAKYFDRPNDEVYFVTVEPNRGFKFELPTGNEKGAYVGEWVPGGYTKHGTAEAVISNSGNYTHNNNFETFKGFFGNNNVTKIK
ncbi:MAG: hypothetical protein U0T69_14705, partial [Chitinophagales bacterium]